ncbi:hypothetical protein SLEP1_g31355 [Rubroshorea leprosula]|uniref:Uncharacterized protein n=1 Tax=Rubroshorea leprosula TaxID=152421 RepID=A0AAV5KAP5_9ROSI|nr:hypothetical protein SLEP1_g31355 [Rubroshorea leprosula]
MIITSTLGALWPIGQSSLSLLHSSMSRINQLSSSSACGYMKGGSNKLFYIL